MATSIQDTPADQQTTARYTYHHLRRWNLDTTGTPAKRPNTPAVLRVEIHRWESADGAGLGIYTELPPAYDLAAAKPDHRSTDDEFAGVRPTRTPHRAGNVNSPITAPLATDPDALARQLAAHPMHWAQQSTLQTVDAMFTAHHVTRNTRSAVLQVLADVDGLSYQPDVTDRLGRQGFAVSRDTATDTGQAPLHPDLRPGKRPATRLTTAAHRRAQVPARAGWPGYVPHVVDQPGPAGGPAKDCQER